MRKEVDHVVKQLKSNVSAKWVKGHQDESLIKIGAIGPRPMEAHYNILMDKRAYRRREMSEPTPVTMPMTTERATLQIDGAIITTRIDDHIKYTKTGQNMRRYIQ